MTTETIEKPAIARTAATPRRRPRIVVLQRIAAAIAIFLAVLALTAALLPSSFWRWLIIHEASSATGRPVTIDGKVTVHLFSSHPQLVVEGLSIGNAKWAAAQDMLSIKKFEATLSLKSLLGFHLLFPLVAIDTPVINIERDASGRANWEPGGSPAPTDSRAAAPLHLPVIQQLILTNGSLNAVDRVRKLTFNGRVSVQENQNAADNHALKLRGSGKLNGKPFQLILDGEPLIGVQPSKPYGFTTTVTAADIKLSARASISHPFNLAALRAEFQLSGSDLADVYYLTGLAMPNTAPYEVSGTLVRDNLRFTIDDFRGKLGGSDVSGKLGIDTSLKRPRLTATLISKQLNLKDMAAPLGTQATPESKSNTLARPAPPAAAAAAASPANSRHTCCCLTRTYRFSACAQWMPMCGSKLRR